MCVCVSDVAEFRGIEERVCVVFVRGGQQMTAFVFVTGRR